MVLFNLIFLFYNLKLIDSVAQVREAVINDEQSDDSSISSFSGSNLPNISDLQITGKFKF